MVDLLFAVNGASLLLQSLQISSPTIGLITPLHRIKASVPVPTANGLAGSQNAIFDNCDQVGRVGDEWGAVII